MPYTKVKKGNQFCVYKEDADGNPEGDSFGCHDTEKEADEQIAALYANEKSVDETLIVFGGAIKALDNGKLGGYLVRFTSPEDPDLTGDYFSKDTDFDLEFPARSSVYYDHGMDPVLKKRKLGWVDLLPDEVGVWAEMQMQARDEYEKAILGMAKDGMFGWSSGTASHLVEREQVGNAMHIKRWPLGLDASLTPTPAEYRNEVISLKSYLSDYVAKAQEPEAAQEAAVKTQEPKTIETDETKLEKNKMENEEIKTIVEAAVKEAADTAAKEAIEEYKKSLPAIGEVSVVQKDEKPFKSFGEQLQAVMGVATRNVTEEQVNKLEAVKATGLGEAVPAEGGFLVQTDIAAGLLKPIYELGQIAALVDKVQVGPNANGMVFNAIDETSRATGSRYGGVQAHWLAEAGTKTASKPVFRQIELKLKKLIGLCYATDELLQDTTALAAVVSEAFRGEFTFMLEDAIVNGDGVGKPLGALQSGCLVTVAKEANQTATTIVAANIIKMWARMASAFRRGAVWNINQDIEPQLFTMFVAAGQGGVPVYMPANGLAGVPYGTLFGRPVIPTEYNATLGTVGDVLLANWGAYQMIDKGAVQEASSIHVQFITDETAFRFVYRCDGQPKWASAVTPAKGSNTLSPFVTLATRA